MLSALGLVEDTAGRGGRKIGLTQVNPVSAGSQTEIKAIVDDQRGPVERDAAKLAGTTQKTLWPAMLRRVVRLVAQLDQRCARVQQLIGKTDCRSDRVRFAREEGEVNDGIERRQGHADSLQGAASGPAFE